MNARVRDVDTAFVLPTPPLSAFHGFLHSIRWARRVGGGSVRGREKTPISGSAPVQQLLGQRSKEVGWGLSHLGLRMTWSGTVRKQAWTAAACELLAHCLLSVPS